MTTDLLAETTALQLAAEHLQRLGYEITARSNRTRFGVLDIVVHDETTLVFCEVRVRRGKGQPWESAHERKQRQTRRMAAAFLADVTDRPRNLTLRFDALGVTIDETGRLVALDHLEGAF